jgi:hypothetical protein
MADNQNDDTDDQRHPRDYKVGYGKPPKASRFKPGQSGNPKGRAKGVVNTKTFLEQELNRKQRVTVDGKVRYLTNRQITILAQLSKARKGDPKAFRLVMEFDSSLQQDTEVLAKRVDLAPDERAILHGHLDYIRKKQARDHNDE